MDQALDETPARSVPAAPDRGVCIRPFEPADVPAAQAFIVQGMRPHLYPLALAPDRVQWVLQQFAQPHPDRLALIALRGDSVVGGLSALVAPMLWFERCEAHVLMCRAVVPGVGRRLLRALLDWVNADLRIRRVVWPQEFDADPRISLLAARLGFAHRMPMCVYYKG